MKPGLQQGSENPFQIIGIDSISVANMRPWHSHIIMGPLNCAMMAFRETNNGNRQNGFNRQFF